LIRTPSGNILLDCGEGTTGQLTRFFGKGEKGIDDVLRNLKCIFVSHAHGDHHMGLAKLLRQRRLVSLWKVCTHLVSNFCLQLLNPPEYPLYIVSVRSIHRILKEIHELEDLGLNDDPRENGVVQVISEALNVKWDYDDDLALRRTGGNEPWLDIQLSVHCFLVWSAWRIEIIITGPEKMHWTYVVTSI
jgi:ribonuclease Z